MAIANELEAPEWVDSGAMLTGGLDLLGLRLPVQTIGGALLNGVTTVTPSIRYVALRAWLIHQYGKTQQPDTWDSFTAYAARIESGLVLGNLLQDRSISGLIGFDEATLRIDAGADPIEISSLVKSPATTVYAGPSEQLGISWSRGDKTPGITIERGVPLAEAVAQRLDTNLIARRLVDGKPIEALSRADLLELGALVRIDQIPDEERAALIAALVPSIPLANEIGRVGTYTALLALANSKSAMPDEQDVFRAACSVNRFREPQLDAAADGWLMYCVRDSISVTQEAVLATVMGELTANDYGGRHGTDHRKIIGELLSRVEEHDAVLRQLKLFNLGESIADFSYLTFCDRLELLTNPGRQLKRGLTRWIAPFDEPMLYSLAQRAGAGALSLSLVAWMTAVARVGAGVIEGQESFGNLSYQGWRRLGLREVILPELERFNRENPPLTVVLAELAYRTVGQHLRIAWSRLQADLRKDVALLGTDGNLWLSRGKNFGGGRTASRLQQAISWLRQLKLIDETGTTDDGKLVLKNALSVLGSTGTL